MRRIGPARTVAVATVAVVAGLAGCSGGAGSSSDTTTDAGATTSVTPAVDVPEGVSLTERGSPLKTGEPATVVYPAEDDRRSVLTVTVQKVREGSMQDFKHFSLDPAAKASTPYYVRAAVRNEGPGGLGGAAVPLYGLDSNDTFFAPTTLVGEFDKCPGGALPKKFKPGDKARRCLVFLVPKGAKLEAVQVRTESLAEPVSWRR